MQSERTDREIRNDLNPQNDSETTRQWVEIETEVKPLWRQHQDDPEYLKRMGQALIRRADDLEATQELYQELETLAPLFKRYPGEQVFLKKVGEQLIKRGTDPKEQTKENYQKLTAAIQTVFKGMI
jgi:chaperonin cofactor prefoldin